MDNIGTILTQIAIPKELLDIDLPTPGEVDYWSNRHNRVFYLDYDIDDDAGVNMCLDLIKTINLMNFNERDIPEADLKPIYLFIECYGGDLSTGFHLADTIKASRIPIYTVAMGDCMSAAFIIFISGKKRFAYKHTQLLCHQGSAVLQGSAADVESAQASYKRQLKEMDEYILANTNIDPKVYARKRKVDWYLSSEEVIKYNVADKLIDSISEIWA